MSTIQQQKKEILIAIINLKTECKNLFEENNNEFREVLIYSYLYQIRKNTYKLRMRKELDRQGGPLERKKIEDRLNELKESEDMDALVDDNTEPDDIPNMPWLINALCYYELNNPIATNYERRGNFVGPIDEKYSKYYRYSFRGEQPFTYKLSDVLKKKYQMMKLQEILMLTLAFNISGDLRTLII